MQVKTWCLGFMTNSIERNYVFFLWPGMSLQKIWQFSLLNIILYVSDGTETVVNSEERTFQSEKTFVWFRTERHQKL